MFRSLRADEVDVRVATIYANNCTLLLYKDARCDQNILDETVGQMNWQRHHNRDNANCIVSIWDESKKQWVEKEDTGTESYTEKEKGLASDSFKRACFNWGIGRELYTAPFIKIYSPKVEIKPNQKDPSKYLTYDKFFVKVMEVESGKITRLEVWNDTKGICVFDYDANKEESLPDVPKVDDAELIDKAKVAALRKICKNHDLPEKVLAEKYGHDDIRLLTLANYMDFKVTGEEWLERWDKDHEGKSA